MPDTLQNRAYQKLIEHIAAAREDAGLTQQAVADRLGRPQSYIAKVEGLERRLDVIEFVEIAIAIGEDPVGLISIVMKHVKIDRRSRRR